MADILATAGETLAPLRGFLATGLSLVTWIIIIAVVGVICSIIIIIILTKRNYNFTIVKFDRNQDDILVDIGKEPAMVLKFGGLGQRIVYWKKSKIYTRYPEKKVGLNKAYFKRNKYSNEWEDFRFKENYKDKDEIELDSLRGKMISYNVGIRAGLKDQFEKKNFLRENIVLIASVTFVLMIGVMTWLLFDKWLELSNTLSSIASNINVIQESSNAMLGKLDNICMGGSGIKPA
jgi:hypothetical protein